MQDANGKDIVMGAAVAITGTVVGLGEIDAGSVTVQMASGARVAVVPTDVTVKPTKPELVVEAPEDAPGAGGVGVQKPKG